MTTANGTTKIYGSRFKALRLFTVVAVLFGGACYFAWTHDAPTKNMIGFYVCRFAVPPLLLILFLAPVRILLGQPLLEIGPRGLRSYRMLGFRETPWSDVRGLELREVTTSRTKVLTLQIMTRTQPIILVGRLLSISPAELQKQLVELPHFKNLPAA